MPKEVGGAHNAHPFAENCERPPSTPSTELKRDRDEVQTVSLESGEAAVWGGAVALLSAGELLNPVDYKWGLWVQGKEKQRGREGSGQAIVTMVTMKEEFGVSC